MPSKQKKPFQADGRTSSAYVPLTAAAAAAAEEPLQPQQQQLIRPAVQTQQHGSSCYAKVTSWLNSTSCSGANAATVTRTPGPRTAATAGPLLTRATSMLWYMGLGGLLYPRAAPTASSAGRAAAAAARAQPQPMTPPSPHFTTKSFPTSHPLTAQQLEQSAGFSTSAAAAAPPAVQAVAKGVKARSTIYLGPLAAAAVKVGDDLVALVASFPRTMRTLQWAVQAGISYKRVLVTVDPVMDPEGYARALSQLHDHWAQRLTEVCRSNGGVYVKAGQFAAAFGAVPTEYRKHLALLQDKAKPRPFHVVDRVLRLELGAGAEEVFAEFSAEATAAASLAQVHKARLEDGRQVAVKVQYPGLRGAANADLTTLSLLSRGAQAVFPDFRLGWLYEELRVKLTEELDFHVEIHNAQRLMRCLDPAGSSSTGSGSMSTSASGVTVPKAHVALCTSKVLTMEWIDGLKVNDTESLRAARINPSAVGRVVDEAFAEMTFVHGYIHADPHPGNIMVRTKGRRGFFSWLLRGTWQPFEVVLLDHGSYLSISQRLRQQYCQLWCSLFVNDNAGAAGVAIDLGGQRAGQILPVILTQRGRNREEQKEMQRAAGVSSFGDMTQLLSTAPRDVVELLRIAAVVRNITASLGCSLADRLRINGTWAFRGLTGYSKGTEGEGSSEADKRFSQLGYRLNIQSRLMVIRGYIALSTVVNRTVLATMYMFGQPVVLY